VYCNSALGGSHPGVENKKESVVRNMSTAPALPSADALADQGRRPIKTHRDSIPRVPRGLASIVRFRMHNNRATNDRAQAPSQREIIHRQVQRRIPAFNTQSAGKGDDLEVPFFPLRRYSLGMIAPSGESPGAEKMTSPRENFRAALRRPAWVLAEQLVAVTLVIDRRAKAFMVPQR
jgi:hypothetical protein